MGGFAFFLKRFDFVGVLQGEADFVEAVEQAVFAVFGDVEGKGLAARGGEGLFGQIDRELVAFVGLHFFK